MYEVILNNYFSIATVTEPDDLGEFIMSFVNKEGRSECIEFESLAKCHDFVLSKFGEGIKIDFVKNDA